MDTFNSQNLTKKQIDFFEKLKENFSSKPLPSFEKLKDLFEFKSKNSIKQYFDALYNKNYILNSDKKFYINPKFLGAKLAHSSVKAGFAAIMDDKIDSRISFDNLFNLNSSSIFVFKVSGDSMCEIGILDGDYVVIQKTQNANFGDIVLAIVDNEFTLKTLKKDKEGIYLQPENKNYPNIRPKNTLTIFGIAIGITRKIK